MNSEYRAHRAATVRRVARRETGQDKGLHRFDIVPAVRFPFNKLAFLTFNTTAQFRNTFWSQSQLVDIVNGVEVPRPDEPLLDAPISRRFVELSADVNGPDARENLGRAEELVRAALPSLDRTVCPGALPHGDRQLQRHPQDRKHGQHRRERDVVHIRHEHAVLRQAHGRRPARDSARGHQRHHQADLQHRCALGAVGRRAAVAQQRADVALHAGAAARAHVAVRRRHRHVQDRLRRAIQPFQELQRRCRVGAESAFRTLQAGATCASGRTSSARTSRARPTTSTRTRPCGFSRTATASRTRSTGTSRTSR